MESLSEVFPKSVLPENAVLIIGCQRSGTTLMRLVLEAHPSFTCFDESTAYGILAGEANNRLHTGRIVVKIPRFTEQIDSTPWVDYGAPTATVRYARQPLLFLVRHPLDVVTSMLRLGDGDWFNTWVMPIIEARAARDGAFAARWQQDRETFVTNSSTCRVAIAALYWLYKNESLERYRSKRLPVYAVRYENLVTIPEPVLKSVLAWLGEPWSQYVTAHHLTSHQEVDEDGLTVGNTDPSRAISDGSVGAWREALSDNEVRTVRAIAGPLWRRIAPEGPP